jgi:hypothetical protein
MFVGHKPPTPAINLINGACDFRCGEWLLSARCANSSQPRSEKQHLTLARGMVPASNGLDKNYRR